MWGICFDVSVLGGALCQNVVEYETLVFIEKLHSPITYVVRNSCTNLLNLLVI